MADLDADPFDWARGPVRRRAAEEELGLESEQIDRLADVMVPALELSQAEDPPPVMVLFLYPRVDRPIVASVKVRAEALDEGIALEELSGELTVPAEMLEQRAVVETVETRSGSALHDPAVSGAGGRRGRADPGARGLRVDPRRRGTDARDALYQLRGLCRRRRVASGAECVGLDPRDQAGPGETPA